LVETKKGRSGGRVKGQKAHSRSLSGTLAQAGENTNSEQGPKAAGKRKGVERRIPLELKKVGKKMTIEEHQHEKGGEKRDEQRSVHWFF